MDFKHKFETETGQGIYSGEGQIEVNGTYNDAYVDWLEQQLHLARVGGSNLLPFSDATHLPEGYYLVRTNKDREFIANFDLDRWFEYKTDIEEGEKVVGYYR